MLTVAPIRSRFLPLAVWLGRSCNCGNSDFAIAALEPDLATAVAHIGPVLRLMLTFHDALISLVLYMKPHLSAAVPGAADKCAFRHIPGKAPSSPDPPMALNIGRTMRRGTW
jgi:hypothetical protein